MQGKRMKERRKIPFVKRNVYHNNCGVLYPLDDFQPKPVKDDFLAKLRLHRKRYGW